MVEHPDPTHARTNLYKPESVSAPILITRSAQLISIHLIHGFTTARVALIASRSVAPKGFVSAVLIAMLVYAAFNLLALSLEGKVLVLAAAYAGIGSAALLILLMSRRAQVVAAQAN